MIDYTVFMSSFLGSLAALVLILIPVFYFVKKKLRNFNPLGL